MREGGQSKSAQKKDGIKRKSLFHTDNLAKALLFLLL
jgi:hypothetical protein